MAILELNHLGKPHLWSLSVAGPPLLGILWTHPSPAVSLTSSATAPNLWPSPQLPALPPSRPPHLLPPGWKGRVCKYERLQLPDPYLQTHLSTHLPSCLISEKVPFLLGRSRFSFMSWSSLLPTIRGPLYHTLPTLTLSASSSSPRTFLHFAHPKTTLPSDYHPSYLPFLQENVHVTFSLLMTP